MSLRYQALLVTLLTAMPGLPAQVRSQVPSRPGIAPADSPEALLQNRAVQKELHLGSQQVQRIDQIVHAVREKHQQEWDELRGLAPAERRRKEADLARTISQEVQKRLTEVLEPNQARRLEQIHRQRQGLGAFADPVVEKALRLTAEQKSQLKTIGKVAAQEALLLFRGGAPSSFPDKVKKIETIGRKAVEKAVALLTDGQKKTWQELIGKPFTVRSEPPRIRPPE